MKRTEAIRSVTPAEFAPGKTFLEEGYEYPLKGAIGQILAAPNVLSRDSTWRVEYRISEDSPAFHPEMAKRLTSIPDDQKQFVDKAREKLETFASRDGVHADAQLIAMLFLKKWPEILGEPFLLRSRDEEGCQIKFFGWGEAATDGGAVAETSYLGGITSSVPEAGTESVGAVDFPSGKGAGGSPGIGPSSHDAESGFGANGEKGGDSTESRGVGGGPPHTVVVESRRNWFPWLFALLFLIVLLVFLLTRPGCGLLGVPAQHVGGVEQSQSPGGSSGGTRGSEYPSSEPDDHKGIAPADSQSRNGTTPDTQPGSRAVEAEGKSEGGWPADSGTSKEGINAGEGSEPSGVSTENSPKSDSKSAGPQDEPQRDDSRNGGTGTSPGASVPANAGNSAERPTGGGTEHPSVDDVKQQTSPEIGPKSPTAGQEHKNTPGQPEGDDVDEDPDGAEPVRDGSEAPSEDLDGVPPEGTGQLGGDDKDGSLAKSRTQAGKPQSESEEIERDQLPAESPATSEERASGDTGGAERSSEGQGGSSVGSVGVGEKRDNVPLGESGERSAPSATEDNLEGENEAGGKAVGPADSVAPESVGTPATEFTGKESSVGEDAATDHGVSPYGAAKEDLGSLSPTGDGAPKEESEPVQSLSAGDSAESLQPSDQKHEVDDGGTPLEPSDEDTHGTADGGGNDGVAGEPGNDRPEASEVDGKKDDSGPDANLADLLEKATALGGLTPPLEFVWRIEETSRALEVGANMKDVVGLQPQDPRSNKTQQVAVDYRLIIRGNGGEEFDAGIVRVRYESE